VKHPQIRNLINQFLDNGPPKFGAPRMGTFLGSYEGDEMWLVLRADTGRRLTAPRVVIRNRDSQVDLEISQPRASLAVSIAFHLGFLPTIRREPGPVAGSANLHWPSVPEDQICLGYIYSGRVGECIRGIGFSREAKSICLYLTKSNGESTLVKDCIHEAPCKLALLAEAIDLTRAQWLSVRRDLHVAQIWADDEEIKFDTKINSAQEIKHIASLAHSVLETLTKLNGGVRP
jgi:hypothetical protein